MGRFVFSRHYPGSGSRAMGFCVAKALARYVSCWWEGRAGLCEVAGMYRSGHRDCCILGWHGGHGEAWWPSLADLRCLARRARGGRSIIVGDSNVDFCSQLAGAEPPLPFPLPERREEDDSPLLAYSAVAQSLGLSIRTPDVVLDAPGGS